MSVGVMEILDSTPDHVLKWDTDKPETVAAVRAEFDRLVGQLKFYAYSVDVASGGGTVTREFDETEVAYKLSPQLVGG